MVGAFFMGAILLPREIGVKGGGVTHAPLSPSASPPPIHPLVILVRPQLGQNIGATARAMLNFGLKGLRLVAPRDGWPNADAKAMAAGAAEVLDGVRVFGTVAEAVADCHYVVATTARHRGVFLPVHTPVDTAGELRVRAARAERTAILFGAEKAGLETEEVAHAHALVTIPVNPAFPSLNLAQAVLVVAYEWAQAAGAAPLFTSPYQEDPATQAEREQLFTHLSTALDRAGYFYPSHKREVLSHNLRTLLANADLSPSELRVLHGVVRQFERHLPEKSQTDKSVPQEETGTNN
ncbi:hypothetical protein PB2503_08434 [Parvularcula bermudensis HTCC2503]|uniref:tRNA (cytidine/uridine-2'-O-)-methyltransferase TrmJ n=1 Tax=Parvularcula bermudensis (strain ATCC BAA-594 / HTCC2503 / KCTC 12087) TaxID=314260 RepID=E0TBE5_PARBH|nr:RNA methyltransferase [Parvularcula bermudensis]ADM09742.1 hypothetical protein PB2503_08434 [Parvularcula bermudensis HTCC2503]